MWLNIYSLPKEKNILVKATYVPEAIGIITEVSIQFYQTRKGPYSTLLFLKLKYTFVKYDEHLPT